MFSFFLVRTLHPNPDIRQKKRGLLRPGKSGGKKFFPGGVRTNKPMTSKTKKAVRSKQTSKKSPRRRVNRRRTSSKRRNVSKRYAGTFGRRSHAHAYRGEFTNDQGSPELWHLKSDAKELTVRQYKFTTDKTSQLIDIILPTLTNLKRFTLTDSSFNIPNDFKRLAVALATTFPELQKLELSKLTSPQENEGFVARTLAEVLPTFKTLQELRLSHNELWWNGAQTLANALRPLTKLEELDLSSNFLGSDSAIPNLASALAELTSLHVLKLSDNGFRKDHVTALAPTIAALTSLRALDLSGNNLGWNFDAALAHALTKFQQLEELDLSRNYLGKRNTSNDLVTALAKLTSLRVLKLSNNYLTTNHVTALTPTITGLRFLRVLDLSLNNLQNDDVKALAPTIAGITLLRVLDLSRNSLGSILLF